MQATIVSSNWGKLAVTIFGRPELRYVRGVLIRLSGTQGAGSETHAGRRSVVDERRDGLLSHGEVGRTGIQT